MKPGAEGHIGPSPPSRYAAAPLRFARFAVTAPFRCGVLFSRSLFSKAGPTPYLRPNSRSMSASFSST